MNESKVSHYLWPGETIVGFDTAELVAQHVSSREATAVFLITDPGVVAAGLLDPVVTTLEKAGLAATIYDAVEANPSIASIHAATTSFRESGAEAIVGLGGGSSLDTAKAVKLLAGGPAEATIWEYATMLGDQKRPYPPPSAMPPLIAVPTTAGTGAEATPWAVITHTEKQIKFGVGDGTTIREVALVDPELSVTCPPHLTAATGMDALSHLIEAYVSTNHNPLLDPMILYGIRLVGRSLRAAVARGDDRQARYEMAQASLIGGIAISSKWLGACHSLAHPLSSLAGLHHGLACAIMLPHQIEYSLIGALERYAAVAEALMPPVVSGSVRERAYGAVTAVRELISDIGLPARLSDVGVTAEMVPALAQAAYTDLNWWTNPRAVSETALAELYQRAL